MRFISIGLGLSFILAIAPRVQAQLECPLGWAAGPLFPDLQGANGPIRVILTYDPPGALPPTLIVGGEFTRIGNIAANNIASWDGTIWRPLGQGTDAEVLALTVHNNNLIVGGRFFNAGGLGDASRFVAAWNGSDWFTIGNGLQPFESNCQGEPSYWCGEVMALAVFNGTLYAGGGFYIPGWIDTYAGIAKLFNDTLWAPLFTLETDPKLVFALQVFDPDAAGPIPPALYVGGSGTEPLWSNLLKWDGSQWTTISNWYGGGVSAMTVTNQGLMVGGRYAVEPFEDYFCTRGWSGSSWIDLGNSLDWQNVNSNPPALPEVTSLRQYGSNLIAGGNFSTAGGAMAQNIAAWNGSNWSGFAGTFFNHANFRNIFDMRVHNNELYVGGDFNLIDAFGEINHIVKYNGATWSSIRTATSVNALATIGTNWLVLGGDFGHVDGLSNTLDPYYLGIWNGKDFNVLGGGVNGPVHALKSWSGVGANVIVAGGEFTMAGSQGGIGSLDGGGNDGAEPANRIAMWTDLLINGGWQPMGNGFNNTVLAVERVAANTFINESIYAGGSFTASANGATTFNRVALWDVPSSTWFPMGTGFNNTVRAIKGFNVNSFSRDVIAGGDFTTASGVSANRIAIWRAPNQNGWEPLGSGFNNSVYAIERHNGSTYAAGAFTASGATPVNHVARWTGTAWEQVGAGLNGNVYALRSYNGDLFAACEVTVGGGLTVARWNGTSWTSVSSGVTHGAAKAILPFKTELVVGGAFERAQGTTVESPGLARYCYQGIPWIIRQPTAQSFPCRAPVTFQVDIPNGYEDVMTFQWFKNGQPLMMGWTGTGSFTKTTSSGDALTIIDISDEDEGEYHVVFTTSCGSVTSTPATLTANVICPPCPWDIAYGDAGDGYVGVPDLLRVVSQWGTADVRADVTDDGMVGVPDLLAIISAWGPCP